MSAARELWAVLAGERVFGVLNEQSRDLADGVGWMTESGSVHDIHSIRRTVKSRGGKVHGDVTCPQSQIMDTTASGFAPPSVEDDVVMARSDIHTRLTAGARTHPATEFTLCYSRSLSGTL